MAAGLPPGTGLAAFLVLGLLGGAHCLGMCGPLVTVYADRIEGSRRSQRRQHALFNLGRAASYTLVGGLAGALGAAAVRLGALAALGDAVRAAAGVTVGLAVVAVGLGYLLRGGPGLPLDALAPPAAGRVPAVLARIDDWARGPRIAALGALHGLLPCPLLYPAFLYAFATGSPAEGALSLAAFGLGTIPPLFVYGTALGALGADTRRRLHRALGAAFVVLGTVPLTRGLAVAGLDVPGVPLPMPMGASPWTAPPITPWLAPLPA